MAAKLEVPGAKEIAIEFTSLSKSHSMAGWRVGFACGNRDMVHALGRIKSYLDYGMPQAIQIGAIVALRGPQDVVAQNAEEYRLRRDDVATLSLPGFGCDIPAGFDCTKDAYAAKLWQTPEVGEQVMEKLTPDVMASALAAAGGPAADAPTAAGPA